MKAETERPSTLHEEFSKGAFKERALMDLGDHISRVCRLVSGVQYFFPREKGVSRTII